jgi:hypothetical protein
MKALTYKILTLGFFALFLGACSKDDANILVRNINQTYSQFGGDTFDINGDGTSDLMIRVYYENDIATSTQGDAIDLIGLNGTQIAASLKYFAVTGFPLPIPYYIPNRFNNGEVIDAGWSTFSDTMIVVADGTVFGTAQKEDDWIQSQKFFGFKIPIGSNTHFGWGSMGVQNFESVRIKKLAFDIRPNRAIKAGSE